MTTERDLGGIRETPQPVGADSGEGSPDEANHAKENLSHRKQHDSNDERQEDEQVQLAQSPGASDASKPKLGVVLRRQRSPGPASSHLTHPGRPTADSGRRLWRP